VLDKDNTPHLAFCVFNKELHLAFNDDCIIVSLDNNRLETVLFDALSDILKNAKNIQCITIPAGPAPFTQLRILRAIQLGLATGFQCETKLVNMFDILFSASDMDTGSCFLETRRGDYFFQTRLARKITDEGLTNNPDFDGPTISDDPKLSTVEITRNLAKTIRENNFTSHANLIYGITLPYAIPPKA